MRHTFAWAFAREVRYHSHHGHHCGCRQQLPTPEQARAEAARLMREEHARQERLREYIDWKATYVPPPPHGLVYRIFDAIIVGTCYLGVATFVLGWLWFNVITQS
jgi:hypothetical protein